MKISLLNNSILGELNEEGVWIYKSNPDFTPFKKDGTLKAQYADMPRFKVINQYEDEFIKQYSQHLEEGVKEVAAIMSKM